MFVERYTLTQRKKIFSMKDDDSKAFDCMNHLVLIAKLYNYGISTLSINIEPKSMNASVRDLE